MSRICYFTGKKPKMGKRIARRGIAKKSGGIGLKTTGITTRRFVPNLQTVKIIENGTVKRVKVSAKYLKTGKVVKAPKRTWKKPEATSAVETPQA
ncbi:MAG TPA: 50S ribosomal protein L28 [Candidatus Eisenbacteria bacterium]|jgi:large subunit ribosomal protein L28|nr:50S ribosomal protein L28 [Candidatus Eisenbacteria bacterium]